MNILYIPTTRPELRMQHINPGFWIEAEAEKSVISKQVVILCSWGVECKRFLACLLETNCCISNLCRMANIEIIAMVFLHCKIPKSLFNFTNGWLGTKCSASSKYRSTGCQVVAEELKIKLTYLHEKLIRSRHYVQEPVSHYCFPHIWVSAHKSLFNKLFRINFK